MRSDLNSIRDTVDLLNKTIRSVNKTVKTLARDLEEHRKQTATKLMDIEGYICDSHGCFTCGGTGGWRRVVYLDMTDPNTNCPSGWSMTNYNIRTCGRASDGIQTCDSVFFPVSGGEYSQVCGKMKAYQWGWTPGFYGYNGRGQTTIDQAYFNGVAVMHGSPRQHIWSFVAGAAENDDRFVVQSHCLCDLSIPTSIPLFVGDDYFCESGYIYISRDL